MQVGDCQSGARGAHAVDHDAVADVLRREAPGLANDLADLALGTLATAVAAATRTARIVVVGQAIKAGWWRWVDENLVREHLAAVAGWAAAATAIVRDLDTLCAALPVADKFANFVLGTPFRAVWDKLAIWDTAPPVPVANLLACLAIAAWADAGTSRPAHSRKALVRVATGPRRRLRRIDPAVLVTLALVIAVFRRIFFRPQDAERLTTRRCDEHGRRKEEALDHFDSFAV